MVKTFDVLTVSPGELRLSVALATARAGGFPILDFEFSQSIPTVTECIHRAGETLGAAFGVKLDGGAPDFAARILAQRPAGLSTIILTPAPRNALCEIIAKMRDGNLKIWLEAHCLDHARLGEELGADGLIAKGHEAGGRVGEETTFILLQRFRTAVQLPVFAQGGIGLHTAAACVAAGAAGIVLDHQLALTNESALPEALKKRLANFDGSETVCIGSGTNEMHRIYSSPGQPAVKALKDLEAALAERNVPADEASGERRRAVARLAGWEVDRNAVLLGQDACFAAPLARQFRTVGGVIAGMRLAATVQCEEAVKLQPLAEGSALARSNGTRYPILQGPMTRVSDVPEFAVSVAEGGALPFLALALLRGKEVRPLLAEAHRQLGSRPWGVGILGFVPPELRQEQVEAILENRPAFALIAGGRPDQARAMEDQGIKAYLHVPSPGLLRMFAQQSMRRFVFEGRECGGHVGPRTSWVLWNQMVETLLALPEFLANPADFHIVFAGGIHDAASAAMVSVISAPLAARGAQIGALIGTAYLFTEEAVVSGAIQETFQEQARSCHETVLLESGPGHATRCVNTPFAAAFAEEKRKLLAAHRPAEEVRLALEELNLGRLRMASKGVTRAPGYGKDANAPKLQKVSREVQFEQGMFMIGQVAGLREAVCTVAQLHHDICVEGASLLAGLRPPVWDAPAVAPERPSDVAIVGMSCLLPKAGDLQTYWENILAKVDAVGEVPVERWSPERYFDADPKAKDKIYSRWGGFLDDTVFDPMQYGMPPATLRSIEPSQLLTLKVVREALADAGYLDRPFDRERVSVILGAGGGAADLGLAYGARSAMPMLEDLAEFRGRSAEIIERLQGRLPEWTEDSFAGILTNVAAGRVANRFDFGGSNYTVDAACASSLAAVALALKELETGTSDMVITGGIDAMQNPFTYLCFSKTHALSPRGRCRTFDHSADGIAISEGIVMLVLKRLRDAERDGDRIYAVIKAAGSSSDGKDRGLTAPRPEGQARALRRAYRKAGLSPATVGLVEAHGTGTVAGDSAEVQALAEVFSQAQAPRQGVAIGSVKSMIGHTKCAAGAAGLAKAALALHHRVLPPTLGVTKPNPRTKFEETPFYVNSEARPWLERAEGGPRRAGVSAFGFGGTNFHVVLEEYENSSQAGAAQRWADELFLLRPESLATWETSLAAGGQPELRDLAFTAWTQFAETAAGGTSAPVAIVASSVSDLREKIASARKTLAGTAAPAVQDPRGIYFSPQPLGREGKVAFLFPGQGSQYPQMLQDLLIHFPEIRAPFEQADRTLAARLGAPLTSFVFPPPAFDRETEQAQQQALTQTNVAQPALGAADLAMFALLQGFGLQPDMAGGHSYGEYAALAAAGAIDAGTLMTLSEARGRCIVEGAGAEPGTMAAVEAHADAVNEVLAGVEGVCLANANAPKQSVISGTREAVGRAVEIFTARGITARQIPVACAFHSQLVAPARERFVEYLAAASFARPAFTVFSNTTAAPHLSSPDELRGLLADHLVKPVEFVRQIEAMYEAGARLFIEAGPKAVLTGLVDQILTGRPKLAVASNRSGRPGLTQLLHLLGQLAAEGVSVDLSRLYRDRTNRRLNLAALAVECGPRPIPPTAWLVNGARAIPASAASATQPKPSAPPKPVPSVSASAPVRPAPVEAVRPVPGPPASPKPVMMPELPPAPAVALPASLLTVTAPDGAAEVMAGFHHMMQSFLDTQKTVMLSYLGAPATATVAPAHSIPAAAVAATARAAEPPALPRPAAPPPAPVDMAYTDLAAAPAIATPPPPPTITTAPGLDRQAISARLLAIVSDRTGYPPEMLDPDLDLEADLGIDSIKRVEILGTLQESMSAGGGAATSSMLERLAGQRTLRGIIDAVAAAPSPASAEPAATTAGQQPHSPQASAAPAAARLNMAELSARLISIVSDRTGYPAEMLSPDLDLEADLGIDSIKRVEILGTFQEAFPAALSAAGTGLMEKLAGARSLRSILAQVEELAAAPSTMQSSEPAVAAAPTVAAVPAAPAVDRASLLAQLVAIVSDRTGYPAEMLDVHLDLEADLGIDSIKRVEILGSFLQQAIPGGHTAGEGLMEKLSGVRTLHALVEQIVSTLGGGAKAVTPPVPIDTPRAKENGVSGTAYGGVNGAAKPASREPEAAERIGRYTLAAAELPALNEAARAHATSGVVLVAGHAHDVPLLLLNKLRELGYQAVLAEPGTVAEEAGPGHFRADFSSPGSVHDLVALVRQRQGEVGGLIHLLPLHTGADAVTGGPKPLFHLLKAAGGTLRSLASAGGAFVLAATAGASDGVRPEQAGITGLMKTLALEWPDVTVKSVDLNHCETAELACSCLLPELSAGDGTVEVCYDGPRRQTPRLVPSPASAPTGTPTGLGPSSVVLITGGARGITALAAERLAQLWQPTLVLVGRSPLPPAVEAPETAGLASAKDVKAGLMQQLRDRGEAVSPAAVERAFARLTAEREVRRNLATIESFGSSVHYRAIDVRDAAAFGALIDEVYSSFGRIDGVIHGAGVIEDKLMADKTAESFDRVFDTKVQSAFTLAARLRPESLRFLLFYSSVSGRFGNRGQGDYAAANEVLNKLAVQLDKQWPCRAAAINWGPWDTGGMVSAEVRKQFALRGVELIEPGAGLRHLENEIRWGNKGEAEIVIGGTAWNAMPDAQATAALPLLAAGENGDNSTGLVREFRTDRDLFLNDHRLDGQPVLPFAVATELIAEAVAQRWPGLQVTAVRDARVLHGVVVNGTPTALRVVTTPALGPTGRPSLVLVEVSGAGPKARIHYRAKVELADRLPAPEAAALPAVYGAGEFSLSVGELYERWLFHGPLFQGIRHVRQVGLDGVSSRLATSRPHDWLSNAERGAAWLVDPLMFDSALQLLVVWAREHWDMTALPAGFESLRRFAGPPATDIRCEIRIRPNTGGHMIHADIYFLEEATGRMLAIVEDMQGTCSHALNRLASRPPSLTVIASAAAAERP